MTDVLARWAEVAQRHPRPELGERVRIIGRGVSGIVVSLEPLAVRDGRGIEHTPHVFAVRSASREK